MVGELFADGGAQGTSSFAVNDTYRGHARHSRVIQVGLEFLEGFIDTPTPDIKLHGNFWTIFVARQYYRWLCPAPLPGSCLAFTYSLQVVYADAGTQRTHLDICFAAIRREAKQFGILTETEHAYGIANL